VNREREKLRQSFRPSRVELLFVGESPPASGRFFYARNSGLYRAMRDAFQRVDSRISDENFLAVFKAYGCYLIDLCPEPVDKLSPTLRRATCGLGVKSLAQKISRLQPASIAPLLRSIVPDVEKAMASANWTGPVVELPYPGRWIRQREAFFEILAPAIQTLRSYRSS
jgi:hypothetical protein